MESSIKALNSKYVRTPSCKYYDDGASLGWKLLELNTVILSTLFCPKSSQGRDCIEWHQHPRLNSVGRNSTVGVSIPAAEILHFDPNHKLFLILSVHKKNSNKFTYFPERSFISLQPAF